jgi:antirestriction protein
MQTQTTHISIQTIPSQNICPANQLSRFHRSTNNQTKQTRRHNNMCEQNFSRQINPQTTNTQLRVYVANLGKYNEGELCGAWLNLPASNKEIKEFLKNQVGLNSQYEEYSIHDYESDFSLGEYENLYDLNVLAVKLEQMNETEKTIVAAYCSANGLKDTLSILNTCEVRP